MKGFPINSYSDSVSLGGVKSNAALKASMNKAKSVENKGLTGKSTFGDGFAADTKKSSGIVSQDEYVNMYLKEHQNEISSEKDMKKALKAAKREYKQFKKEMSKHSSDVTNIAEGAANVLGTNNPLNNFFKIFSDQEQ